MALQPEHFKPRPKIRRDVGILNPHDGPVEIIGKQRDSVVRDDGIGAKGDGLREEADEKTC